MLIRHLSSTLVARMAVASLLAAVVAPPSSAQAPRTPAGHISVQWLGHAAFEIISPGGTRLLIDPWLTTNPTTPDSLKDLARYSGATKPDAILVTHSHDDHSHDAKAIAQRSGSRIISVYDWVNTLGLPASQVSGGNVGGGFTVGDVRVRLVPAIHSSEPGGRPIGFIIDFADGRSLYDTGDTWLFGDMSLIQELRHPDIILVCAGGVFTMDPRIALLAINKYFKPKTIIPMHYGTFPALATPAEVRAQFAGDRRAVVMTPGQKLNF
jgi:L-ascorbate metabolism protein UlaG (beta-lactamase superfamily)